MPADAPAAFFSYSREDSEFALRLASDLKERGANVWLDQLDIQPGQRWARAVQDALNSCPRFIVILSPASISSTHVEDEVTFALEERKTVIPVFYRDCKVPFQLRPFQYVDFRSDYARSLNVMLKTLGVAPDAQVKQGLPLAAPAQTATETRKPEAKADDHIDQAHREGAPESTRPHSSGVFSTPRKVVLAVCLLLIVAFGAFWAIHKRSAAGTEPQADAGSSQTSNAASNQPSDTASSQPTTVQPAVQPASPAASNDAFNGTWISHDGYSLTLNIGNDNVLQSTDSLGFYYAAELGKKVEFRRKEGHSGGTDGADVDHLLIKRNGNVLDVTFFRRGAIVGHQTVTVAADGRSMTLEGQFMGEKEARVFTLEKQQ